MILVRLFGTPYWNHSKHILTYYRNNRHYWNCYKKCNDTVINSEGITKSRIIIQHGTHHESPASPHLEVGLSDGDFDGDVEGDWVGILGHPAFEVKVIT